MRQFPADINARYEILGKLGEGGIGQVFQVRHRLLDELRVIKVIHARHADNPSVRERFRREAKAATRLRHPNIAEIQDFQIGADGHAYLVMEFIAGMTLRQIITHRRRMPVDLAVELGVQGLSALGYLHGKGYLHRDVAPDNLMVKRSHDGRPLMKLIDLGLAKRHEETVQLTATNMFVGKVRYASPERFRRPLAEPLPNSDLYSLGVVLYELLTGVCPVRGSSFEELMASHLLHEPPPFDDTDLDGRLNADLRRVLLKSLAKDPQKRYSSAEEFARELAVHWPAEVSTVDQLESLYGLRWSPSALQSACPGSTSETTLEAGRPDTGPASAVGETAEPAVRVPRAKRRTRGSGMTTETAEIGDRRRGGRQLRRAAGAALVAASVVLAVAFGFTGLPWSDSALGPGAAQGPTVPADGGSDALATAAPDATVALGQPRVVVAARPWAEIVSVVDSEGRSVPLAGTVYTPALLTLAPGLYRLQLRHPAVAEPRSLDVQVPATGTTEWSVDFGAIDADSYFATVGLTEILERAGS